jgi:hypothetical protein
LKFILLQAAPIIDGSPFAAASRRSGCDVRVNGS